jgi:predicted dehydrogenase
MKRRKFLEMTSLGSAAVMSSIYLPNTLQERKIKAGLIGCGWYGMVDLKAALKTGGIEVIALCDIDSDHLNDSAGEIEKLQGTRPKTLKYYNDLLDLKGLEVLFIGTIPHWHALQFIAACNRGLDIYCEKPLSYDVMEGIAMVKAAQKADNIVQIGFQRRQADSFKKAKELINSGKIGELREVVAQIHYHPGPQDTKVQQPPASLDWEEWCGPAPKLDYRPSIGHMSWRLEKEYGNGHLVDWGIHHIDIIRKIMDEDMPGEIFSAGGLFVLGDQITTPDTLATNFKFRKAPVQWHHRLWGNGDVKREYNNGIFFYGEKGALFADDSKVVFYPEERNANTEEYNVPTPTMQDLHVENFLDAVRKKDKNLITCAPEDAFKSTATVQLAMISYNTGSKLTWDQEKFEIIENSSASSLLRREYRGKYIHP